MLKTLKILKSMAFRINFTRNTQWNFNQYQNTNLGLVLGFNTKLVWEWYVEIRHTLWVLRNLKTVTIMALRRNIIKKCHPNYNLVLKLGLNFELAWET